MEIQVWNLGPPNYSEAKYFERPGTIEAPQILDQV